MISEGVYKTLILLIGKKRAFVFFGRARLLQILTSFIYRRDRFQLIHRGVDAEVFPRTKGKVLDIFKLKLTCEIFWRDGGWKLGTTELANKLRKLRMCPRAEKDLETSE